MKLMTVFLGVLFFSLGAMSEEVSECKNRSKAQVNFIMACENFLLTQELGSTLPGTSPQTKKRKCTRVANNINIEKLTDKSCRFWNVGSILSQDVVQKYMY